MQISNPIYDSAFKYLLEDTSIARVFLESLTQLNIESVELQPQELTLFREPTKQGIFSEISVYRLDVAAKIRFPGGKQQLIILEIQKQKHLQQTIRFRKYLGKQYLNSSYTQWHANPGGQPFQQGIPLFSIYLLGERVPEWSHLPVIEINATLRDGHSNTPFLEPNPFVHALYHSGLFVHIPAIQAIPRDERETLLQIFNQRNIPKHFSAMQNTPTKNRYQHILEVDPSCFPEKFLPILERLHAATLDPAVREAMELEDDFYAELDEYEFLLGEERRLKEQAQQQLLREQQHKEQAQQQLLREQQQLLTEQQHKEQVQQQRDKEHLQKLVATKWLIQLGIPLSEIAHKLSIPEDELEKFSKEEPF
ncbi:MAG: hypothetical protein ACKOAY_10135 [Haliscomenobacter sp.]